MAAALFARPIDAATYYVDPTGGTVSSDSYDGTADTWEGGESTVGPKRTLAGALEGRGNGDVVIALPGVYDDGVSNEADRDTGETLNRVSVPAGVTLKSRDGAEKTIIMGAESPNPVWKGCGTNAVRCAYVSPATPKPAVPAGRLVGFTLTGGRTGAEGNNDAYNGGGVKGAGYCVDCIVSNNACYYRGGASHSTIFVRSRFLGNNDCNSAVGYSLYGGTVIHCLVKNNSSFSTAVIGSTYISAIPRQASVYNSLLMSTSNPGGNPITAYRCIVVGKPITNFTFEDGSHYTNSADVALGPDGMPGPGSVAIDFGNSDYLISKISEDDWRAFDLSGERKRIANGRLDVGCFERDWYEEYSEALSPVGAAEVTNATSYVELSGTGLVVPTNGAANVLLKPFGNAETLYSFFAEVTGSGTLSVYLDGSETPAYTFTEADGEVETKLSIAAERDAKFAYSGEDGSARLYRFSNISYACIFAEQHGVAVSGDFSLGTNYVASGQSATFTVSRAYDSDVVCTGVEVNGEFFPFEGHPEGHSFMVSGDDRSTSVVVTPVYKDGLRDWYVDANNGDDANTGLYTNNAFRTLKAALENPKRVSGEVVWALPGDYNDSVCTNVQSSVQMLSRAALGDGMILRSMEGAEKTIIRGAASTDESAAENGCGPGAVRCVYFSGNGIVEGFTLTDGRSPSVSSTNPYTATAGGGVYGELGGYVVDCILSNNHARSGGALRGATVIRGRLFKNGGTFGVDAFSSTTFIDSYLANDKSGLYNLYSACSCYNCTFGSIGQGPRQGCRIYNSVLLNSAYASDSRTAVYNCLMVRAPADTDKDSGSTMTDCIVTNADAMAIGDYYRPEAGSPAIDAGSWARYELITNKLEAAGARSLDLFGGQRIYNGSIDIGCGEYDWRGDFAKALADRGVSVIEASEDVTLGDPAGLDVAAGQSLRLCLVLKRSGNVSFAVEAPDLGEVEVLVDGVATAVGEDGRVSFDAEKGEFMVEIVCSDVGQATVSDVRLPRLGFMVIFD